MTSTSNKNHLRKREVLKEDSPVKSSEKALSIDKFIWGKLPGYKWWPAIMIDSSDCGRTPAKGGYVWVFWFGDHRISEISKQKTVNFMACFYAMFKIPSGKLRLKAITEVVRILASTADISFSSPEELFKWAKEGFPNFQIKEDILSSSLFSSVKKYLEQERIKNEIEEDISDEPGIPDIDGGSETFIEKLKSGELKIEEICISCHENNSSVVLEHPFFFGGLCLSCKECLQETVFAIGSDSKNICCLICFQPGFIIICENVNCPRSYCRKCLVYYLGYAVVEQIIETSPWFCFFCTSNGTNNCPLKTRENWEEKLMLLFRTGDSLVNEVNLEDFASKRPITVLSLFDGISTGKIVLDMLGIAINKYYSCEVDNDAINVSKFHHKDIIYLGDVRNLTETVIGNLDRIDLVIGGSPCNDLSLVNPDRKGLYDFTGTGCLFFDFFHILNTVKRTNKNVFYLFENVAAMLKRDKAIISSFLMHEPALVDAKYFSPQSRARYFWGNIPGLHSASNYWNYQPGDELNENILDDCILPNMGRKAVVEKIKTITTQRNSLIQEQCTLMPVIMNGQPDVLWVTELEKIFGFPLHYTDVGNLGISKRRELIGRAWSVPVIKNIFQTLRNFFECR